MNLTVVDLDIFNCLLLQCCYSHFFRIIIVAHVDRTAANRQLAFGTYVRPKPRKRWRALLRKTILQYKLSLWQSFSHCLASMYWTGGNGTLDMDSLLVIHYWLVLNSTGSLQQSSGKTIRQTISRVYTWVGMLLPIIQSCCKSWFTIFRGNGTRIQLSSFNKPFKTSRVSPAIRMWWGCYLW